MPVLSLILLCLIFGSFLVVCFVGSRARLLIMKIVCLLVLTILFTFGSVLFTRAAAYDQATLKFLEFGWPFPFVTQNQEKLDPPLPRSMFFVWEPSSNTASYPAWDVRWSNLFRSAISNLLIILGVSMVILRIQNRSSGKQTEEARLG